MQSLHASVSPSGLPTTPAAPSPPPTEMSPPLSPPRGLVAVRTPRGVLLHWDPPELVPKRLDGYILEGRQGSQGWEVGSLWLQVFLVHGVDSSLGSLQATGGAHSLHQVIFLPVVPFC